MTQNQRRTFRWFLITLSILILVPSVTAYRNWPAIRSWVKTQQRHRHYINSPDPLERELATGSIRAGSAIDVVLSKYPKGRVIRHERFITVEMGRGPIHAGIILMALDGKLVFASDSDLRPPHIFFQALTDGELRAAFRSYEAECDREFRARNAAFAAVLGVAVNIHGDEDYLYCPPLPE